jgi:hypothetical protein
MRNLGLTWQGKHIWATRLFKLEQAMVPITNKPGSMFFISVHFTLNKYKNFTATRPFIY